MVVFVPGEPPSKYAVLLLFEANTAQACCHSFATNPLVELAKTDVMLARIGSPATAPEANSANLIFEVPGPVIETRQWLAVTLFGLNQQARVSGGEDTTALKFCRRWFVPLN